MKGGYFLKSFLVILTCCNVIAGEHNPGQDCLSCHEQFKLGGTVFTDSEGTSTMPGVSLQLIDVNGGAVLLSNDAGNVASSDVPDGSYLVQLGDISSKTWHTLPGQGSCNTCHEPGGNTSAVRTKLLHPSHTSIPADNDCTHCH